MTEDTRKELNRIWEAQETELALLTDLDVFLSEDVLEIKREQYLSDGKWVTTYYTLVTGTGGPHVEFTTNYQIHVYWGGEIMEFATDNELARATIDEIEQWLNEVYRKD